MQFFQKLKDLGPGVLVTAAFIGPGTITTCTLAGANYGYVLLWGLTFSILATIILQEKAARLGLVTRMGLGEAVRQQFANPAMQYLAIALVLSAILVGNAAYETGNILGAALSLEELSGVSSIQIGNLDLKIWGPVIGLLAWLILELGSYKSLEKFIIALVILMSLTFITTAFFIQPDLWAILKGMFVPAIPEGSFVFVMGLIGTTVVPYNLFLHASVVQERWKSASDLGKARTDLSTAVILGGLISMSIVITAAMTFHGHAVSITGAGDLAEQLEPLLGNWARIFMSLGLFAAGISSAITAPLAAAYATSGILGWKAGFGELRFKLVWRTVLLIGIVFSLLGYKPIQAILFAQIANGLLLPFIAIFLVIVMNNKKLLSVHANNRWQNIAAIIVVLVAIALGLKSIVSLL